MKSTILITVDCLRPDHLGCYGYDRPASPNIDRFAETATVFEHGYANCPGTRWALQSIHTGISTIQIDGLGIPESYSPLATHLQNQGYTTGGFAVNGFASRDYRFNRGFDTFYSVRDSSEKHGLAKTIGRKVDDILDNKFIRENLLTPVHEYLRYSGADDGNRFQPAHSDEDTVEAALSFIDENQGEPYFLWVHLMDAHTPYGYWPEHLRAIRGDANIQHTIHPGNEELIEVGKEPPANVIDTYDAAIRSADEQFGRLFEQISDDATIILTGDHGEEFGQFYDFHQASVYSTYSQVPIIVRDSELETGRVDQIPAQHLDIPPTILFAADAQIPDHWEGYPLQTSDRSLDDPIFITRGAGKIAVRKGNWKYINAGDDEELYNVPHSGTETDEVSNKSKHQELKTEVQNYLSKVEIAGKGRTGLEADNLSNDVEENLKDLGYV